MSPLFSTKIVCIIAFYFLALPIGTTQHSASIGSIETYINNVIENLPQADDEDYEDPSEASKITWTKCVENLWLEQLDSANYFARLIGYEVSSLTDTTLAEQPTYILLNRQVGSINYWGTYVFNPQACRKTLIIQSPHPKNDLNTGQQGIFCFKQLDAGAFFLSGTHRCNNSFTTNCSGTTSTCGFSDNYRISDIAHNDQSVFQVTTNILNQNISNAIFLQLHGFSKRDTDPFVIMSNGTKAAPSGRDYALLLREELAKTDALLTFKVGHLDVNWTRLLGTTNVQGRLINGSGDPCKESAGSPTGQFIHLEQEKNRLRNNIGGWQKLATALSHTIECEMISSATTYPEHFDLTVFPNPFSNQFTIELSQPLVDPTSLMIFDLSGKIVYKKKLTETQSIITVSSNLPVGFYLLSLKNKNGITIRKLIKQG